MSERQASTFRRGEFTDSHNTALKILTHNKVQYLAEEVIHVPNEFDFYGRPITYKVDILVHDSNFGKGIININGESHNSLKRIRRDEVRTQRLIRTGFWVEDILNEDVNDIMDVLERHRRVTTEWP